MCSKINVTLSALILLCMVVFSCDTDSNVEQTIPYYFIKYYGEDGDQTGVDMVLNDDGSMILLGTSTSPDKSSNSIFVVKVDAEGNVLWQKDFGSTSEMAKDIEKTSDGNYILLSEVSDSTNTDVKLIKINPEGTEIDSVVYGYPGSEHPKSITRLLDGGFIVTGTTEYDSIANPNPADPTDPLDVFHYRCDVNLDFSKNNWYEQFGPGKNEGGVKTIQKNDTLFYVLGFSNANHGTKTDQTITNPFFYFIDGGGNVVAQVWYGNPSIDNKPNFITDDPGNGYLVISTATSSGSASLHISKFKEALADNNSNPLMDFDKDISITGLGKLSGVSATPSYAAPQGFLITADETDDAGNGNMVLIKIDLSGSVVWSVRFGSSKNDDRSGAVVELSDGRIVMIGTMGLDNQKKMALIKLNQSGELVK